ncbi:uncharacterized protein LOC134814861 [Bolinopsis microptera]|uniref:uncharacterized protein LOC134814861 n=1 Tax=Bolinopsis microptera TaxID=2820187 RepID=UPI003078CEAF
MVLILLISPAFPFLTLTLPYIIAARVTMQESESRGISGKAVFLCSLAEIYDKEGKHVANIKVFMGCTLSLGTVYPWKHSEFYQTWENVSNPLVLLLAVAALIGSCAVIIRMLLRSAQFQQSNSARVVKSIRKTCTISMVQGVLILASSLPLRCYQIKDRLCTSCDGFSVYYIMVARLLVFLGPMFNPWLYSIRMGNVRTFLATKKDRVFNSARGVQMSLSSRVQSKSRKNQSPGAVHKSPGAVHKSPGAVHKSPGAAYKSPGVAYKSPGAVHKSPGAVHKSPGVAYKSPGAVHKSPSAAHKSPSAAHNRVQ